MGGGILKMSGYLGLKKPAAGQRAKSSLTWKSYRSLLCITTIGTLSEGTRLPRWRNPFLRQVIRKDR